MGNATHAERNRLRSFASVLLTPQANCPIVAGAEGIWHDSGDGKTKVRKANGSDVIVDNINTANIPSALPVAVAEGGTGAANAAGARANLGLGTAATHAATDFDPAGAATAAQTAAEAASDPVGSATAAAQNEANLRAAAGALSAALGVNGQKISGVGNAAAGTDALNRQTADARYDAAGAAQSEANLRTAAGALSAPLGVNNQKITGLANGAAPSDAAALGQIPVVDGTASDIQPLAAAPAAGAIGKWADAGHQHQADKGAFRVAYFVGVDASGAPSHVNIAALKVGDQALDIFNITDGTDGSAAFEPAVTVNGQLQQPALDLSGKHFKAIFVAKS